MSAVEFAVDDANVVAGGDRQSRRWRGVRTLGDVCPARPLLWIADVAGMSYLRGSPERSWVLRLRQEPQLELERAGERYAYRAQFVKDAAEVARVNAAMAEKYGRADRIAGALFDRSPPVAIRLIESADNYPLRCLPHVLAAHGYRSLFMQSADGTFVWPDLPPHREAPLP